MNKLTTILVIYIFEIFSRLSECHPKYSNAIKIILFVAILCKIKWIHSHAAVAVTGYIQNPQHPLPPCSGLCLVNLVNWRQTSNGSHERKLRADRKWPPLYKCVSVCVCVRESECAQQNVLIMLKMCKTISVSRYVVSLPSGRVMGMWSWPE